MKRFFNEIDWTLIKELKDVQEKYDLDDIRARSKDYVPFYKVKYNLLMIYEQGVKITFHFVRLKRVV